MIRCAVSVFAFFVLLTTGCGRCADIDDVKIKNTRIYLNDELFKYNEILESNSARIGIYKELLNDLNGFELGTVVQGPTPRFALFDDGLLVHWIGESADVKGVWVSFGADKDKYYMPIDEIDRHTNILNSNKLYLGSLFFRSEEYPELAEKGKSIYGIELQY